MSSKNLNVFTKDNLDTYLKELAKEYRRLNGTKISAEVILIGGAAILANYGFRDMTTDVDAIINGAYTMKAAINHVGDKYGLPNGWLNEDFKHTVSYTPKLIEISKYYKMFYNVLEVRTISEEYLIAMKLRAGRKYKKDLSDIVGILAEHEKQALPITKIRINKAVKELYGGWDNMPVDSKIFIEEIFENGNYEQIYQTVKDEELHSKELLIEFQENYPDVANQSNADIILKTLKAKAKNKE